MLEASLQRMLELLGPEDVVLDVGGWYRPFVRADWVMDLMPFQTRREGGRDGDGEERFTSSTWIQRDICDRQPYPFADQEIDFVVCSHTLEDVRDPVWVCSEMARIARAGYVEVPSRLEEQTYGFQGPWTGWGHHRWLIDVSDAGIELVFKHHVLHNRASDHFPAGFRDTLTPAQKVQTLWWEGSLECHERVFTSGPELDRYLAEYVSEHRPQLRARGSSARQGRLTRARRALAGRLSERK